MWTYTSQQWSQMRPLISTRSSRSSPSFIRGGSSGSWPIELDVADGTTTNRLWHQLTLAIFDFLAHPLSPPYQVDLFNKFIRDFESKLNQLKLVEIGVKVSRQLSGMFSLYVLPPC